MMNHVFSQRQDLKLRKAKGRDFTAFFYVKCTGLVFRYLFKLNISLHQRL